VRGGKGREKSGEGKKKKTITPPPLEAQLKALILKGNMMYAKKKNWRKWVLGGGLVHTRVALKKKNNQLRVTTKKVKEKGSRPYKSGGAPDPFLGKGKKKERPEKKSRSGGKKKGPAPKWWGFNPGEKSIGKLKKKKGRKVYKEQARKRRVDVKKKREKLPVVPTVYPRQD